MSSSENWHKAQRYGVIYVYVYCCWKNSHWVCPAGNRCSLTIHNNFQFYTIIWPHYWMTSFTWICVKKNIIYCDIMSLQSTFLGMNDSVFTNINKFQSISNILDSFLDLICDWLCASHMIHLEPWTVHSDEFCINDPMSCNLWEFKLVPSNSLCKELSNGIWFAYIRWPPGLALKSFQLFPLSVSCQGDKSVYYDL